jgi:hypothetical protein
MTADLAFVSRTVSGCLKQHNLLNLILLFFQGFGKSFRELSF